MCATAVVLKPIRRAVWRTYGVVGLTRQAMSMSPCMCCYCPLPVIWG
jgi:hypothetical protein